MNLSDPRFWLDLLQWFIVLAVAATTWLRKPGEAAVAGLATLRDHVDTQHRAIAGEMSTLRRHVDDQHQTVHNNLAVLGERIAHMPTSEELAELAGSVKALAASQVAFTAAQQRMNVSLDRIETWMVNNK
jgi:hypothetical protein